jgi:hypothetical protein
MVLPFIGLFVVALMITTYVPSLTTFTLPRAPATAAHGPAGNAPVVNTPGGDGGAPAPGGDCDVPRDDETFDAFQARCANAGSAAPEAAPAPSCDLPGDNESFEQFQARCNADGGAAPAAPGDAGAPAPQGDASVASD